MHTTHLLTYCLYAHSSLCSLRSVRAKIWRARLTSPLFNCKRFATDLENIYLKLWEVYLAGLQVPLGTQGRPGHNGKPIAEDPPRGTLPPITAGTSVSALTALSPLAESFERGSANSNSHSNSNSANSHGAHASGAAWTSRHT